MRDITIYNKKVPGTFLTVRREDIKIIKLFISNLIASKARIQEAF